MDLFTKINKCRYSIGKLEKEINRIRFLGDSNKLEAAQFELGCLKCDLENYINQSKSTVVNIELTLEELNRLIQHMSFATEIYDFEKGLNKVLWDKLEKANELNQSN